MRYFDLGNSIKLDTCAQLTTDRENASIFDYNTMNYFDIEGNCAQLNEKIQVLSLENPNLRFRNGYGQSAPCTIDTDSELKNSQMTHGPERMQLFSRNFAAGPNLSHGQGPAQVESIIQQGFDTTIYKECGFITEQDYNRFTPLQNCMASFIDNYSKSIPDTNTIGTNSRDVVRSSEYLAKCGFAKYSK